MMIERSYIYLLLFHPYFLRLQRKKEKKIELRFYILSKKEYTLTYFI